MAAHEDLQGPESAGPQGPSGPAVLCAAASASPETGQRGGFRGPSWKPRSEPAVFALAGLCLAHLERECSDRKFRAYWQSSQRKKGVSSHRLPGAASTWRRTPLVEVETALPSLRTCGHCCCRSRPWGRGAHPSTCPLISRSVWAPDVAPGPVCSREWREGVPRECHWVLCQALPQAHTSSAAPGPGCLLKVSPLLCPWPWALWLDRKTWVFLSQPRVD